MLYMHMPRILIAVVFGRAEKIRKMQNTFRKIKLKNLRGIFIVNLPDHDIYPECGIFWANQ